MFCIFVGYFSDFAFPHTDEGGCFSIKECFDGCGSQCGSKDGVFSAWLAASLDEAQDSGADVDVFGRVKNEMFYNRSWIGVSIKEFIAYLDDYLHWYNEDRIKITLGGMSPVEYRESLGIM